MIGRRRLVASILACGVISLVAGFTPARGAGLAIGFSAPPADGAAGETAPILTWKTRKADGTNAVVELAGADPVVLAALDLPGMTIDRWVSFLPVRVVSEPPADPKATPPLLGSYRIYGSVIRFQPRFPLEPGMRYRAEFDPARLAAVAKANSSGGKLAARPATRLVAEFSPPKGTVVSTAKVIAVYPSGELLPENLLRFYVHFSAPMSRGEAYRRIKLLDTRGKPVDWPFLELDQELWSSDGMRFTLLFDPGRIKRGLRPREELGPILVAGRSYSLVIDRNWPDAQGSPLMAEYRKPFRVAAPDDTSPDPKSWSVHSARAKTFDPLEVRFPEPLDHALLGRLIVVQDQAGKVVQGRVAVAGRETIWRFTPERPWRAAEYLLVIGTELEDVAGNSVARPFEVDIAGPISRRIATETISLPFRIGPGPP